MNITTKGKYGLWAMIDLAQNSCEGKPVPLKDIAERQNISEGYLEQLMILLKKSGLVKSVRGAYGGYILARPPQEISLDEVFLSLEGSLTIVSCIGENGEPHCSLENTCLIHPVWREIQEKINSTLASYKLIDLVK